MSTAPQSYANHAHQPRLFIAGAVAWLAATIAMTVAWFRGGVPYLGLILLLFAVACALSMGRVYITALQDRIIRLEMRLRCSRFLTAPQMADLDQLAIKQIVALRFASDQEIPALLERARKEHLAPADIKKAIVTWVPDHHRT